MGPDFGTRNGTGNGWARKVGPENGIGNRIGNGIGKRNRKTGPEMVRPVKWTRNISGPVVGPEF